MFLTEIAVSFIRAPPHILSQICQTQKRPRQKHAWNHYDPPGTGKERPLSQREHTAPGNHFHRKTKSHKAQRSFRHDGISHMHNCHEQNGREQVGRQMPEQHMKKTAAQTFCRQNKIRISKLHNFCPHHLRHAHPACQTDHNRQAVHICPAKDSLQGNRQQKTRHTQNQLSQPHQNAVNPGGGTAAHTSHKNCQRRGYQGCKKTHRERNSASVPDHGKDISAHFVRAKEKFFSGCLVTVRQVHVKRILRHHRAAGQT